jgi:hypothetical protein
MSYGAALGLPVCVALCCACGSERVKPNPVRASPGAVQQVAPSIPVDAAVIAVADPPAAADANDCVEETVVVGTDPLGYRASGQICKERRTGTWDFRYLSGESRRKGDYKEGLESGAWTHWYRAGSKRSTGSYLRGKRSGLWHRYHENGKTSLEGAYDDGLRQGRWRRWHDNGQLYEDRMYLAGTREGLHHKWNPDGLLQYIRLCKKDVCKIQCRERGTRACQPFTEP